MNGQWMMIFTKGSDNIYNEMMDDMYNRTMMIFTMRYNKWNDDGIYNEALMIFTNEVRSNDIYTR